MAYVKVARVMIMNMGNYLLSIVTIYALKINLITFDLIKTLYIGVLILYNFILLRYRGLLCHFWACVFIKKIVFRTKLRQLMAKIK